MRLCFCASSPRHGNLDVHLKTLSSRTAHCDANKIAHLMYHPLTSATEAERMAERATDL